MWVFLSVRGTLRPHCLAQSNHQLGWSVSHPVDVRKNHLAYIHVKDDGFGKHIFFFGEKFKNAHQIKPSPCSLILSLSHFFLRVLLLLLLLVVTFSHNRREINLQKRVTLF